jgi:hypothetical protein
VSGACVVCGGDTPPKRKTCGSECQNRLVREVTSRPRKPEMPSKCCANCGNEMTRRAGESRSNFAKRKTCGYGCGAKLGAKTGQVSGKSRAIRLCRVCDAPIPRPAHLHIEEYRQLTRCGSPICAIEDGGIDLDGAAIASLDRPLPKAIHYARHSATKAELRLMSPAILAAAGVRL